jgi:thiamine-phosphate pyrophosphorylase
MLRGVYAITDSKLLSTDELLLIKVTAALKGGARVVQYRDKSADKKKRFRQASALFNLCAIYNVPLIINDDIELALAINADGVHLGQQDMSLTQARKLLGAHKIIGITCHDSVTLAKHAEQDGANYVAFGACFLSSTKPSATIIPHALLIEAKSQLRIPIVAIGGINSENATQIIATGVDMIAIVNDVFDHDDVYKHTQQLSNLFKAQV